MDFVLVLVMTRYIAKFYLSRFMNPDWLVANENCYHGKIFDINVALTRNTRLFLFFARGEKVAASQLASQLASQTSVQKYSNTMIHTATQLKGIVQHKYKRTSQFPQSYQGVEDNLTKTMIALNRAHGRSECI